jgi:hypothetical protein
MPNIHWKSGGRVMLAAAFAYLAIYLLGPDHVVKSYVR